MAQPTFDQFFSAIAEQESGGRYNAVGVWVGGDRAYGKYQVMGANIPSWTAKYFGKRLTPNQFLNNPSAQEAVAKGVLKSYYNKYGARGAASAWYSGNPSLSESTRAQPGGPSIKGYVDSVISKAYGYPSTGSTSSSTSTTKISTGSSKIEAVVPKLSSAELAEQYGFVSSFLNSNKELKKLFESAVKGQWSADKFQAKLRNTKWWKNNSQSEREYLLKLKSDPATAKQEYQQYLTKAHQIANAMGLVMNDANDDRAAYVAKKMATEGWDEGQARFYLGKYLTMTKGTAQGEAGEALDDLKEYAYGMGVSLSDSWYLGRLKRLERGLATTQDFKSEILVKAKAQFPQWSKQLDGGQTVADIAQPYMQSMAQILELPAGSVNLFDPTIKKALSYTNSGTLKKEAKPLWQFENELRADPRWKKTQNAQDSMFQVGHQILSDFGFAY